MEANIPIELLIQMSGRREIDPWDVDLVKVIERLFEELLAKKGSRELQEAAQIILSVSVLLRLKSERLFVPQFGAEEGDLVDFGDFDYEDSEVEALLSSPQNSRDFLQRKEALLRPNRTRSVTLDELVALFKEVETQAPRLVKRKRNSLRDLALDDEISMREDEDTEALEIAHEENLEAKIELFTTFFEKSVLRGERVPLSSFDSLFLDCTDTFLAALFYSHGGKAELWQEKFYGEIVLVREKG